MQTFSIFNYVSLTFAMAGSAGPLFDEEPQQPTYFSNFRNPAEPVGVAASGARRPLAVITYVFSNSELERTFF